MSRGSIVFCMSAWILIAGCGGGPDPAEPRPAGLDGSAGVTEVRIKGKDIRAWQEKQKPTGEGNFILGYQAYHEGRYEEAIAHYRTAVRIDPRYAQAWAHLGATQYRIGRFEEARTSLRKAIEIEEKYANAYYNLALVLDKLGERPEALRACRRAVELDPSDFQAARLYRHLKKK